MFHYFKYEPSAALKCYIDFYWFLHTDMTYKPVKAPVFADACTDIFANMGSSAAAFNQKYVMLPGRLYIGGATTSAGFINSLPGSTFAGIRFKPAGLHALYKFPLAEIVDRITAFHDPHLFSLLDIDSDLPDRLDRYFLSKLKNATHLTPLVEVVLSTRGVISVDELAQKCNVSNRTLERHAYTNLGIGPKAFISIVRFQTVLKVLQKVRSNGSMMEVAYQMGYYDPAHLTREVKKYSGLTPSTIFPGPRFP